MSELKKTASVNPDGKTEQSVDTGNQQSQQPKPEALDGAQKDWKAEAERKEQLLQKAQAELAKIREAEEAAKKAELEKKGEFEKLKNLLEQEKADLVKKNEELTAFQAQVIESKKAELAELVKDFDEDKKAKVELGKDLDAQIVLAKAFAEEKIKGSLGPNVPNQNRGPQTITQEERIKMYREGKNVDYFDSLPILQDERKN